MYLCWLLQSVKLDSPYIKLKSKTDNKEYQMYGESIIQLYHFKLVRKLATSTIFFCPSMASPITITINQPAFCSSHYFVILCNIANENILCNISSSWVLNILCTWVSSSIYHNWDTQGIWVYMNMYILHVSVLDSGHLSQHNFILQHFLEATAAESDLFGRCKCYRIL